MRGHINTALESIFSPAVMIITPHKLYFFGVRIVLSSVFKAPFGKSVWFTAGSYLGMIMIGVLGSIFLEGGFQSDDL